MSIITENNPSVLSVEGRGRASSRYVRSYQKVSQSNIDNKTILAFLRKHSMHRTITSFMAQSHNMVNVQPIIKVIEAGGSAYRQNIEELVSSILTQSQGKQNVSSDKLLVLEFYLRIWYCVDEQHLNKVRVNELKQYINRKGDILSQISELLPYFALPYANDPNTHPFLQRIFKVEWKEQLKSLILQILGKREDYKKQEEWLNVVEDMIGICKQLYGCIDKNVKEKADKVMERVNLYQFVIEKNKRPKNYKKQREISSDVHQFDYKNVERVKNRLMQLQKNQGKEEEKIDLSVAYHLLQMEIVAHQPFKQDKKYVKQLIKYDILNFGSSDYHKQSMVQYQKLKLMQFISSYYVGRKYLSKSDKIIHTLKNTIQSNFGQNQLTRHNMMILESCFDILTKLVPKADIFKKMVKEQEVIYLVLRIFKTFKKIYMKGNKALEQIIISVSSFLSEIALHRQGRSLLAKTHYFQTIVEMISQAKKAALDQKLQIILCKSIYLMLVGRSERQKAKEIRIKDILLDRMLTNKTEGYQTIVGYIIERIEQEGQFSECSSDSDIEKSVQFDYGVPVKEDSVFYQGQFVSMKDIKQNKKDGDSAQRSRLSHSKERKRSLSKRMLHKEGDLRPYSRQKYVRKSQNDKK